MKLLGSPHPCEAVVAEFIHGPLQCGLLHGTRKIKFEGSKYWVCKFHRHGASLPLKSKKK